MRTSDQKDKLTWSLEGCKGLCTAADILGIGGAIGGRVMAAMTFKGLTAHGTEGCGCDTI